MLIKNSLQGVVPAMSLQDNHMKLIVANWPSPEIVRAMWPVWKIKSVGHMHAQIWKKNCGTLWATGV